MNQVNQTAVYAGTFDPITNGHLWVIKTALELFGNLTVAIGLNPEKQTRFSLEERLELIKQSTSHLENLTITYFPYQYLVKYAASQNAKYIVRGIRSMLDFAEEQRMRNVNFRIDPNIETVFLTPPLYLIDTSSSLVKGLVGPEGWEEEVAEYVPGPVLLKLKEREYGKHGS